MKLNSNTLRMSEWEWSLEICLHYWWIKPIFSRKAFWSNSLQSKQARICWVKGLLCLQLPQGLVPCSPLPFSVLAMGSWWLSVRVMSFGVPWEWWGVSSFSSVCFLSLSPPSLFSPFVPSPILYRLLPAGRARRARAEERARARGEVEARRRGTRNHLRHPRPLRPQAR